LARLASGFRGRFDNVVDVGPQFLVSAVGPIPQVPDSGVGSLAGVAHYAYELVSQEGAASASGNWVKKIDQAGPDTDCRQ
jgi:hypothetical protein